MTSSGSKNMLKCTIEGLNVNILYLTKQINAVIAQLGERHTEDVKVMSSILIDRTLFWSMYIY